jgi:hypothetical protein
MMPAVPSEVDTPLVGGWRAPTYTPPTTLPPPAPRRSNGVFDALASASGLHYHGARPVALGGVEAAEAVKGVDREACLSSLARRDGAR